MPESHKITPGCDYSECCWRYLRTSWWNAGGDSAFHHQIIQ
jgi:hypothetical protein